MANPGLEMCLWKIDAVCVREKCGTRHTIYSWNYSIETESDLIDRLLRAKPELLCGTGGHVSLFEEAKINAVKLQH
jgi:hypothetical protein